MGILRMDAHVSLDESATEEKCSRADLLKWLNDTLQVNFKQVDQACSGACFCQIMHQLFPESIDLGKVQFQAKTKEDFTHNYQLLQDSFTTIDVQRPVPVEDLVRGRFRPTFNFLKWFKTFFEANVTQKQHKYDPILARKGVDITPAEPFVTVIDSDTDDEPQAKNSLVYREEWEETFPWVKASNLGRNYAFCSVCDINLSLHQSGIIMLRRHEHSKIHSQKPLASSDDSKTNMPVPCSAALRNFIQTLDISGSKAQNSLHRTRLVLGPHYPEDITKACREMPFCLYLYGQVALTAGHKGLVALVGFFDDKAAKHRIRLLDALQYSGKETSGEAVVSFLTETFKNFDLPSKHLCAFYTDRLGECSGKVATHLKDLSPNIVALGGLYDVSDAACHAGVMEHFGDIKELFLKIHSHYTTLASNDDTLKILFAGLPDLKQSLSPQSTPCQVFAILVRRVVGMWEELNSCFSTGEGGPGSSSSSSEREEIGALLKSPNLRIQLSFLDSALGPLWSFQNCLGVQNGGARANLVQILREASGLLPAYATRFLRPQAMMRCLKQKDATILQNPQFYLPVAEQNLGGTDVQDYLEKHQADTEFQKSCLSFYASVTTSLMEGLPLSDGVLRSMSQVLSPAERLKVSGNAVTDLASRLGVCPADSAKLVLEFLEYQQVDEEKKKGKEDGRRDMLMSSESLEDHWGTHLRKTPDASVFRKLMLTLLALPCPPLEAEKVFAKAAASVKPMPTSTPITVDDSTSSDSDVVIQLDLSSDGSQSDSAVSTPTPAKRKRVPKRQKKMVTKDAAGDAAASTNKGDSLRGLHRGNHSLRQKPAARTFFQAGTNTGGKPLEAEAEDSPPKDPESPATPRINRLKGSTSSPASPKSPKYRKNTKGYRDCFLLGEMVWVKDKSSWWPALVVEWRGWSKPGLIRRVEKLGDGSFSRPNIDSLLPFAAFAKCFSNNSYTTSQKYKTAIYQALELAGVRCKKSFSSPSDSKEEEMRNMLDWAFGGFQPTGAAGLQPDPTEIKQEVDNDSNSSGSDYHPPPKRGRPSTKKTKGPEPQDRGHILKELAEKRVGIEGLCISCGSYKPEVPHPLFEGGLCEKCKENFKETVYRCDADGSQSYCTVCCHGNEVLLCSNSNCCRCFCKDCLDFLVAPGTFERLQDVEPWSCYICRPGKTGALRLRSDWNKRLQELFANNGTLHFRPHPIYPTIPAHQRRPITVLSLFKDVSRGLQVLKELGIQVREYYAAELYYEKEILSTVELKGQINYIQDVRSITRKHFAEWGEFDLLIGGNPRDVLPTANKKGYVEGTGRPFFEYYRILTMMRPREEETRPFFFLFENVVSMSNNDKQDISRFLQCNPVMLDSVSSRRDNKPRYFWGNLPGMTSLLPTQNGHAARANSGNVSVMRRLLAPLREYFLSR